MRLILASGGRTPQHERQYKRHNRPAGSVYRHPKNMTKDALDAGGQSTTRR